MKTTRLLNQSKIFFLILFAIVCAGIWGYQLMYVLPARKCEAAGRWWWKEHRVCGVPVEISTITGRPNPVPKAAPAAPTPTVP